MTAANINYLITWAGGITVLVIVSIVIVIIARHSEGRR